MRLRPALLLTIASVAACSRAPPPIGRGLPVDFGYTPYFNDRVSKRYPPGSDETKLIAELRREGFAVTENHDRPSRYRLSGTYEINSLVCKDVWAIEWTSEQGKIKKIWAESRDLCL